MPYSENNAGTEADPYQITTPAQFNERADYESDKFILMNDIDMAGIASTEAKADIDLNGFTISNLGDQGFQNKFSTVRSNVFSDCIIENGGLHFNYNQSRDAVVAPFGGFTETSGPKNVVFSGSITNTSPTGSVAGVSATLANSTENGNCIVLTTLSAHDRISGICNAIGSSGAYDKYIFAGQMNDLSGTAEMFGLSGSAFQNGRLTNSFWDTEVSGVATSNAGTGKTTAELQTLATFTDLATAGLDEVYDMVAEADHVAQTWFLPTGMYPRLFFEEKTIKKLGPITKDGLLQSGVMVQVTAYDNDAKNSGKQDVGDYVSDVDGMITIPNEDVPEGKTLFFAPHYKDGTSLFSDQLKSTI